MVDFMVISLPRSRSTWLANWLTTDKTLCLHDPLRDQALGDLDEYETGKAFGISDTSLFFYGARLNRHPAKKLIIHRRLAEVSRSIGDKLDPECAKQLDAIYGMHVQFDDINHQASDIWEYLIGDGFDQERFDNLTRMNIEPHFPGMKRASQHYIRRLAMLIKNPA